MREGTSSGFWHSSWPSANGVLGTIYDRGPMSRIPPAIRHFRAPIAKDLPSGPQGPSQRLPSGPSGALIQFWAPPKPFIASVIPEGVSMIREKRTTVTVSSTETSRP